MTLELVNTIATACTAVVIAASAVAALMQLRHVRASNQIAALVECRQTLSSPEFVQARSFVIYQLPEILRDPANHDKFTRAPLREELAPIAVVGNFIEALGVFVKYRIVDRRIACDQWGGVVLESWGAMAPAIAIMRGAHGQEVWENFEYLASLSKQWSEAHPNGAYPKGAARMPTILPSDAASTLTGRVSASETLPGTNIIDENTIVRQSGRSRL